MKGTYNIYHDGVVVSSGNVITLSGKLLALDVLAGKRLGFVNSVVVGIGTQNASDSDKKLDFEITGADVTNSLVDPVNEKIYFKTSLPAQDDYLITELGCFSSSYLAAGATRQSAFVYNFNGMTNWVDTEGNWALDNENSRMDQSSITYTINNDTVIGYGEIFTNMNSLPDATLFSFAYYCNSITDLTLRLKTDQDNYFEYSGWPVSDGYSIGKAVKSDFTTIGTPTWDSIQYIEVQATSTSPATLALDAIRYDHVPDDDRTLISRSVLTTPQRKLSGVTMDIEYVMDIDI